MILIGIDPGVKTGIGYINGNEKKAESMAIHRAMSFVNHCFLTYGKIHVRVEDARKRKWFGNNSNEKMQGAGSVKRDCKIWEDFLDDLSNSNPGKLTFELIHPVKNATKLNQGVFKRTTGIVGRTNEHGRDAYMLIHNFQPLEYAGFN